jgi:hypothetical protein
MQYYRGSVLQIHDGGEIRVNFVTCV